MSKMCTTRKTLKLVASKERSDVINLFLHAFTNSGKLKVASISLAWIGQK